jgi:hypothetical protein
MDIGGWLRGLGLERYEQAFRENEIDLRVLPKLTAEDLKELGVAAIGHRRLLIDAIAALPEVQVPLRMRRWPRPLDRRRPRPSGGS